MLDRYLPFRTSKPLGKEFDKLLKKYGVSQSWMLRYLFSEAMKNLDLKNLKTAIKMDPFAKVIKKEKTDARVEEADD